VGVVPVEANFVLPHLSGGPVVLEVKLQGLTQTEHRVRVALNDYQLGEVLFTGQDRGTGSLTVPLSVLVRNAGTVRLISAGGMTDASLLESLAFTYSRSYAADSGTLKFTLSSGARAWVDGFGSSNIRLLDITDPFEVTELSGEIRHTEAGYGIHASANGRAQRTLLALTEDNIRKPASMIVNRPGSLRQAGAEADMVILSHGDFAASLEPLRALRSGQGLKVKVIDIEDIYDEFSFGNKTPEAIRDFLTYTRKSWLSPPRYVLLVGDATFDPRNHMGKGAVDYVPARMVDTGLMETVSDEWYVDFESNGKSQMAIGRLPARTREEVDRMVARIITYEAMESKGGALLISDLSDTYDFKGANDRLAGLAKDAMAVDQIDRGSGETAVLRSSMLEAMNQGRKIVNYLGHGSVDMWRGNFFTSADARALTNAANPMVFIGNTCLNGYFVNPDQESIGEALLRAEKGGAAAAWVSTAATDPGAQAEVNARLFDLLLKAKKADGTALTLGEAAAVAKSWISDKDVKSSYILFGDPAMRLK
jgi:hypothetical protein